MQLGEGAHGVVYLAKMQDTYVAVKVRQLSLCSARYLQTEPAGSAEEFATFQCGLGTLATCCNHASCQPTATAGVCGAAGH